MAWTRVQGAIGPGAGGGSTTTYSLAFTAAISSGSLVVGTYVDASTATTATLTVKDNKGNSGYTLVNRSANSALGVSYVNFYQPNVTNGMSSITVITSVTTSFGRILIEEWQGGATSSIVDSNHFNWQIPANSTAANTLTSGTTGTLTGSGHLIWGSILEGDGDGVGTATTGTNFTTGLTSAAASVQYLATEYLIQGAAAATAATFTPNTNTNDWITSVIAFNSASTAVQNPFAAWDYGIYEPPKDIRDYRDWIQQDRILNLLKGQDKLPVGAEYFAAELHHYIPQPIEQTWTWKYNSNLVGKDKTLPIQFDYTFGTYDPPPAPEPYPYREWNWKYNQNLIGKDVVSGKRFTDLTAVDPREYRHWDWRYLLELIGKDVVPGKRSTDLSNPPDPRDYRTWEYKYLLELIGKDKLPTLNRDFPNPTPVYWYNHWQQRFQLTPPAAVTNPFFQTDWPLPTPVQWYQDWAFRYLLELIGQDTLPNRQQDWPNPYPVQWYQSLERDFGPGGRLAPFSQKDWPNPTPVTWDQFWAIAYNRYLLPGQDQFPIRQSDWPNPQTPVWRIGQETNLLETPFQTTGIVVQPFAQYDWPLPYPVTWYQQWAWKYVQELIGKDVLPNRQQDWPLPYPVIWDRYYSQSLEPLILRGRDTLPIRQQDWPVPALAVPIPIDEFYAFQNPNLFPPSAPVIVYILMPQILL